MVLFADILVADGNEAVICAMATPCTLSTVSPVGEICFHNVLLGFVYKTSNAHGPDPHVPEYCLFIHQHQTAIT